MPEVRMIDANALHAKICEDSENNYGASVNIAQVLLYIETAPTVEAEPVRHGRWIEDGEICGIDKYKCSLCSGEVGGLLDNTKYCCFCGARMDADEIAERRAAADDYAEY